MELNEGYKIEKYFNDEVSPVLEHLRWLMAKADIPYAFVAQVNMREFEFVSSKPPEGFRKLRVEVEGDHVTLTVYPSKGKKYTGFQAPSHIVPWFPDRT
jgi:hypothetical protein